MNNPTNLDSQTDPQSANKNQFAIIAAPEAALLVNDAPAALATPNRSEAGLAVPKQSEGGLAAPKQSEGGRTTRRKGRIACLPKVQRDMVNHMLWHAAPYKNIVAALDEAGFTVTERNV